MFVVFAPYFTWHCFENVLTLTKKAVLVSLVSARDTSRVEMQEKPFFGGRVGGGGGRAQVWLEPTGFRV